MLKMGVMLVFHSMNRVKLLRQCLIQPVLLSSLLRAGVCYFIFRLKPENYSRSNI